jgi:hypothetical protein
MPDTNPETLRPAGLSISPFCIHLWSKKASFLDRPPLVEEDILDASRHCWCRKTMQVLGPDREVVAPADCRQGRTCFESIL